MHLFLTQSYHETSEDLYKSTFMLLSHPFWSLTASVPCNYKKEWPAQFFKIVASSSFAAWKKKKCSKEVWNNMKVSKWHNFHFWVNYPFTYSICVWVTAIKITSYACVPEEVQYITVSLCLTSVCVYALQCTCSIGEVLRNYMSTPWHPQMIERERERERQKERKSALSRDVHMYWSVNTE